MLSLPSNFIKIQLHPLNYCALALACSIACVSLFYAWIIWGITIIAIALVLLPKQSRWWLLVIAATYLGGAYRFQSTMQVHHAFVERLNNIPCTLKGAILSIEPQEGARTKQKITIQTDSFLISGDIPYRSEQIIQIYLTRSTNARVADEIEIHDFCLKKNKNESYDDYLIKENIAATVFLTSLDYKLIHRPSFSLSRGLFYFKQNLLARCRKKLSRSTFAFFASVFLGNKSFGKKQMEEPKDNCKTWGISHYLARSGLHMVIFICIWFFLLNLMPLSFRLKQFLLIGIGILYHILSWPSISFIRAFMSFLLFKSCTLLQLPSQLLHLLTLVTIAVLLHNPMQLFFLDFQLSFGLTFALAWFNHVGAQKTCIAAKY